MSLIAAEENVTLFANYRAVSVKMNGECIESIIIKHIETGEEQCLKLPCFQIVREMGPLVIGGSDYRMGREARSEFGEALAPEVADKMTMGASVQWYSVDKKKKHLFRNSLME